jgi:hypothetical protein
LQGDLTVILANSFVPASTDSFTIITSNQTIAGLFANIGGDGRVIDADGESSFSVVVNGNKVTLDNFVPEPSPALSLLAGSAAIGLGLFRRRANAMSIDRALSSHGGIQERPTEKIGHPLPV